VFPERFERDRGDHQGLRAESERTIQNDGDVVVRLRRRVAPGARRSSAVERLPTRKA
jgi:hypothetical protein